MSSHPVRIASRLGPERGALDSLRRETLLIASIGLGALVLCASVLTSRWLVGALLFWAFAILVLYRSLGENRAAQGRELASRLGWASLVTLQRGWLLAFTAGFLLLPMRDDVAWLGWAPALAYTTAALLDHVDGRLARRLGSVTGLGAKLDMELDAAGILTACAVAILYGKLPLLYLAIGLARYAFVLGISWRMKRRLEVRELHPSWLRRWLAGFQMGFLAAALWPVVPWEASYAASAVFGSATLLLFLRDWLVVSCRLDPLGRRYQTDRRWRDRARRVLLFDLPGEHE
jgi:CDP-diacylglycerol--glycerol-3-phosphate 3-phosphatidyltransferase